MGCYGIFKRKKKKDGRKDFLKNFQENERSVSLEEVFVSFCRIGPKRRDLAAS